MTKRFITAGIDLGTTFSSLAVINEHGEAEIISNAEGERLTPSAVLFDGKDIVVGRTARDYLAIDPTHVVLWIKRNMGDPHWKFDYEGRTFDPTSISALILRKLKQNAEEKLECSIQEVVITVPAYFDNDQRRATIAAGEIAGFEVLKLINEPTAAAVAFGVGKGALNETVLVYDLGGGTFDVSIVKVEGKDIEVLATDGDHELGGKDFDDRVMTYVAREFQQEHRFDLLEDPVARGDLQFKAERAKHDLSIRQRTTIVAQSQGRLTRVDLTREQFEALIRPELETTRILVKTALEESRLTPTQIDRVLLVGGSTRVPAVRQMLYRFFGKEPDSSINPDEVVSLGAAFVATMEELKIRPYHVPRQARERVGDLHVSDVTAHSLGIAILNSSDLEENEVLIRRNSKLPLTVKRRFLTPRDGVTTLRITVLQGDDRNLEFCKKIGEFYLTDLPGGRPSGQPVDVSMKCNEVGIVEVSAIDVLTNRSAQTTVHYSLELPNVSLEREWMQAQLID